MKTRILSYLLVFSMILALLPASALAEGRVSQRRTSPPQWNTLWTAAERKRGRLQRKSKPI